MFEVNVKIKETDEIVETTIVTLKEAEAIFKGYENDNFYSVEARFIRQGSVSQVSDRVITERKENQNE